MSKTSAEYQRLALRINEKSPFAIAVSGGVDSMTLAIFSSNMGMDFEVYHAISPAVPPSATARVREFAVGYQWQLREIVAGEFQDSDYLANPYNRCFHCKKNLYGEIKKHTNAKIYSGTNLDDLSDFRPGLEAAKKNDVEHPYVDAKIGKAQVRSLARELGAEMLADMPSSPCLSSRVETGISIESPILKAIDGVESWLDATYGICGARCRVRHDCIAIEMDSKSLKSLSHNIRERIASHVTDKFLELRAGLPVVFEQYRRGSAFVEGLSKT